MSKKLVLVVAAVFYRFDDRGEPEIALFRRKPPGSGAGFWEFPGGKIEPNETEIQALEREIIEELGLRIKVGDYIGVSDFEYETKRIHLTAYFVNSLDKVNFKLTDHDAQKWTRKHNILVDELAPADRPLVEVIFKRLESKAPGSG